MKKNSTLQTYLTIAFVTALLVSNVITSKQIVLPFGFVMTAGAIVFPITYVLSDVFSEVYGYRWSRITCYIGFAANIFMVGVFALAIIAPAPDYWTDQAALATILGSTPRVLFASMVAFVAGDFINDNVFRKMKEKYPDTTRGFGVRAIVSSLCGEVVDSSIFLPIVFVGQLSWAEMGGIMISEVLIKTGCEVILLPFTTFIVNVVAKKESENERETE